MFTSNYNFVDPLWLCEIRSSADAHEVRIWPMFLLKATFHLTFRSMDAFKIPTSVASSFIPAWLLWIVEPSLAADLEVMST